MDASLARLAQLVEHPLDVGRVVGSSPTPRTTLHFGLNNPKKISFGIGIVDEVSHAAPSIQVFELFCNISPLGNAKIRRELPDRATDYSLQVSNNLF